MSVWLRRDRDYLASQGFYDRKKVGFGHFITPEDLEERQPGKGSVVMTGRGDKGGARCTPTVLVTGFRHPVPSSMDAIAGVEIYRGIAIIPLQFSLWANNCGVILIWTKT